MKTTNDLIIIGAGPGGLTAAQYGSRANLSVLLIEEMASGGQALLIDDLENYPGFDQPVKGMEFSQKLENQARNFGTEFLNASALKISKQDNIFSVETSKGIFTCYAIIFATGAKHKNMGIPGEKEFGGKGVSYCATCDGPFFRNKKILVVGGGDAACDEAGFLSKLSDKVIMVHRRERFRAQKALAERVLRNKNIDVRFNTVLTEIKGDDRVNKVTLSRTDKDQTYEEDMDAVFIFIGITPQTALLPDISKDSAGYILTDQNMETNIPGLFAAGDVRATPFRQVIVAAGEGAVATHSASHHIDDIKGEAYL